MSNFFLPLVKLLRLERRMGTRRGGGLTFSVDFVKTGTDVIMKYKIVKSVVK